MRSAARPRTDPAEIPSKLCDVRVVAMLLYILIYHDLLMSDCSRYAEPPSFLPSRKTPGLIHVGDLHQTTINTAAVLILLSSNNK